MDRMRFRTASLSLAILLASLCAASTAGAASYGKFSVTSSGKQSLTWTIAGGKTGVCAAYSGNGKLDFKIKSKTTRNVNVSKGSNIGAIGLSFTGTQSGSFFVDGVTNCPLNEQSKSYPGPITGCGPIAFPTELWFERKGSSTWTASHISTRDYDDRNYDCAHYLQLGGFDAGALDVCGPKEDYTIFNSAIGEIGGEGLFPLKFGFSQSKLLKIKKGKKKTYTASKNFDCLPTTMNGMPIRITGSTKLSLTFKRTR